MESCDDEIWSMKEPLVVGAKRKEKKFSFLGMIRRKCSSLSIGNSVVNQRIHQQQSSRKCRWRVGARLRCWFSVRRRKLRALLSRWMIPGGCGKNHQSQLKQQTLSRGLSINRVFQFSRIDKPLNMQPPSASMNHWKNLLISKSKLPSTSRPVPRGFVAVYVGQEHQRFVIPVPYLNHPLFEGLLKAAEQEFGFNQNGALLIPCEVPDFEETRKRVKKSQGTHIRAHHGANFRTTTVWFLLNDSLRFRQQYRSDPSICINVPISSTSLINWKTNHLAAAIWCTNFSGLIPKVSIFSIDHPAIGPIKRFDN